MNQRFIALFVLLFVAVAVVAAPVNIGDSSLPARALTKKTTVAKKTAVKKPVAQKPVAAKPAAKPVARPVATPVAKPATKTTTKPVTKPATKPVTSCPIPKRPQCAGSSNTWASTPSVPSTSSSGTSKADKKAAKAAKFASKSASIAAASASAAAAIRPIGAIANAPTKAVRCNNKDGATTDIPLAAIEEAVNLAQAGPLVSGNNAVKFPHIFNNDESVGVAAACLGKVLEEQAVGPDMSKFRNIPSVLGTQDFNQFRVVITTPDASGATTFCGVRANELMGRLFVDDPWDKHTGTVRHKFAYLAFEGMSDVPGNSRNPVAEGRKMGDIAATPPLTPLRLLRSCTIKTLLSPPAVPMKIFQGGKTSHIPLLSKANKSVGNTDTVEHNFWNGDRWGERDQGSPLSWIAMVEMTEELAFPSNFSNAYIICRTNSSPGREDIVERSRWNPKRRSQGHTHKPLPNRVILVLASIKGNSLRPACSAEALGGEQSFQIVLDKNS
ncbi:hypothetical protein R3P38DRAFT_3370071, partial [Favolaschia claudopus]